MWEGDTVTVTSAQSETSMQDQSGEAKERLKEPAPKDDLPSCNVDEEDLSAVLQDRSNNAAAEMNKMQTTVEEEVVSKTDDGEKVPLLDIMRKNQNEKDKNSTSGDHAGALLKNLTMEGSMEETSCPELNQSQAENTKEMLQASNTNKSECPDEPACAVTECWDEYIVTTGDIPACNSEFALNPLHSNPQMYLKIDKRHEAQTGWHFPVGPGLSQEVSCPQWSFPAASYYTTAEPPMPFEGREGLKILF